jgi:hypothetical protein
MLELHWENLSSENVLALEECIKVESEGSPGNDMPARDLAMKVMSHAFKSIEAWLCLMNMKQTS